MIPCAAKNIDSPNQPPLNCNHETVCWKFKYDKKQQDGALEFCFRNDCIHDTRTTPAPSEAERVLDELDRWALQEARTRTLKQHGLAFVEMQTKIAELRQQQGGNPK